MLSALPASFPSDPLLRNPFSTFDGGFTPWGCPDLFSAFKATKPITSCPGSDDPDHHTSTKRKPASDDPSLVASILDERKRRRMVSNRQSARRSRMRKQKHLENLRNQLNRFRIENRELNNRLQFLLHHCNRVRTENEWLRSEQTVLGQQLSDISRIFILQQLQPLSCAWPCNTITTE